MADTAYRDRLRRLGPFGCVASAVLLFAICAFPRYASADERLTEQLFPPTSCNNAACLRGARAFAAEKYGRAAEHLESALWESDFAEIDLDAYADTTLLAAVARERNDNAARAASHWETLARITDAGVTYWAYRALRAHLETDDPPTGPLERLEELGALDIPYPGAAFTRVRFQYETDEEIPDSTAIQRALESDTGESACEWLSTIITGSDEDVPRLGPLQNLLYGHCLPDRDGEAYPGQPDEPSDAARIARAERLYDRVRFEKARTELEAVDFDALERSSWCRARFRYGRTHYRLDAYGRAADIYRSVVSRCHREATATPRIRSLYALGRRHYFNDHFKKSRSRFEQILEDYPNRTHADDALMFLGRIARKRSDDDRERALLRRALDTYPEGDMVREFVWESLEDAFERKNYSAFVDELEALDLPDSDPYYYSQGRLLYFRGLAESKLGLRKTSLERFRTAWRRYPFSFYGYLSHLALRDRGAEVPNLGGPEARTAPGWFYDTTWDGRAVRRLAALGLHQLAADVALGGLRSTRRSDAQVSTARRWRLAALHHHSSRFVASHNVPRRLVEGRPWVEPPRGRTTRWSIAFPSPYRGMVEAAIRAEHRQRPKARVSPYLPLAIMREESGFDADIESWAGAVGLMQLMPATARGHDDDIEGSADVDSLRRPRINIRIGVDHLHLLARYFSDHPTVMVAAYNAGMGAVGDWLPQSDGEEIALWVEEIPYRQTRHYAKRVIGSYAAYQWLAGQRRLDPSVGRSPPTR